MVVGRTFGAILSSFPHLPDALSSAPTIPFTLDASISPFMLSRTQALSSNASLRPSDRIVSFRHLIIRREGHIRRSALSYRHVSEWLSLVGHALDERDADGEGGERGGVSSPDDDCPPDGSPLDTLLLGVQDV